MSMPQVLQQYESESDGEGGERPAAAEENARKKRGVPEVGSRESSADRETRRFGENHSIGKRQTETGRNADEMGLKDRPGFRSWGGKRAKFGTWGGKRGRFATWGGKRSKFNNWGGKRSGRPLTEYTQEEGPIPNGGGLEDRIEIGKRETFKSWGGKRGPLLAVPTSQSKFSNWGGKRDVEYPFYEPEQHRLRRSEFQSWGGKRSKQAALKYRTPEEDSEWSERPEGDRLADAARMNRFAKDSLPVYKGDGFADAEDSSVIDPWKG